MRGRRYLAVALASAMVAGAAGSATSATQDWRRHNLERQPLSLSLPSQWKVVPRSERELRSRIAEARQSGNSVLAATYETSFTQLRGYAFHAFAWPQPNTPIPTDLFVGVQVAKFRINDQDLSNVAREMTAQLRSGLRRGERIDGPTRLRLKVGTAWRVSGRATTVGFGGAKTGMVLYIFAGGSRLYTLTGRTDSRTLASYSTLFRGIAGSARFR